MTQIPFPDPLDLNSTNVQPYDLFQAWLKDAEKTELSYPTAMQLTTVGGDGMPSIRTVLMRKVDARGLTFYTNYTSRKADQIDATHKGAALFYWKSQLRQVHFEGRIAAVDDADSDAYFASRPYGHKISAWASQQSQPLESRDALMARVKELEAKYPEGDVPRPPHWGGYLLSPTRIEFWQEGKYRLHDRFVFTRDDAGVWRSERLNP